MSPHLSDLVLRSQTDVRLVALAKHGHQRAFEVLIERYRQQLLRVATRLAGAEGADDVLQQTLLRAWSAIGSGAEVRHVRGWLFQILRNVLYDEHMSVREAAPLTDDLAAPASTSTVAEQNLELAATIAALAALPEHQRYAIAQTAIAGRTRDEVARDLGLSEGAVRQLLFRARTTLRRVAAVLTPLPLLRWASGPRSPVGVSDRLVELAGASGASAAGAWGSSAALLSGGVVAKSVAAVIAAGAIVGGALTIPGGGHAPRLAHRKPALARLPAMARSSSRPAVSGISGQLASSDAVAPRHAHRDRPSAGRRHRKLQAPVGARRAPVDVSPPPSPVRRATSQPSPRPQQSHEASGVGGAASESAKPSKQRTVESQGSSTSEDTRSSEVEPARIGGGGGDHTVSTQVQSAESTSSSGSETPESGGGAEGAPTEETQSTQSATSSTTSTAQTAAPSDG